MVATAVVRVVPEGHFVSEIAGGGVVAAVVVSGGGVVVDANIPFHVASKYVHGLSLLVLKVISRKPVVDVKTSSVLREFGVPTNSSVEH
jgi:hypothetical protein